MKNVLDTYGSTLSSIDFNISLAANIQCFSKHGISVNERERQL